jgi:hypothetical protein
MKTSRTSTCRGAARENIWVAKDGCNAKLDVIGMRQRDVLLLFGSNGSGDPMACSPRRTLLMWYNLNTYLRFTLNETNRHFGDTFMRELLAMD